VGIAIDEFEGCHEEEGEGGDALEVGGKAGEVEGAMRLAAACGDKGRRGRASEGEATDRVPHSVSLQKVPKMCLLLKGV
jgi:hypothetical protein